MRRHLNATAQLIDNIDNTGLMTTMRLSLNHWLNECNK